MARDSPEIINFILRTYFYEPYSGLLFNVKRGIPVGCYTKRYPELCIKGYTFRLHQLAYILTHKVYPPQGLEIDHINGDRHDNRLINLRLVTKSTNVSNSLKSRYRNDIGVFFETHSQKWVAQITREKKRHKKRFNTKEEAVTYRKQTINYSGN